jgi:hypothetical protein
VRYAIRIAVITLGLIAAVSPAALARGSTHWTRVTPTNGGITDEIYAVRTGDGVLHVVWAPSGSPGQLLHTTVSPAGTVGGSTSIASGWAAIGNPAIVRATNGALVTVAGAQRSTSSSDPIQDQALWSSADSGTTWSLYPTDIATGSGAADPLSAAFGPDGSTLFTTWTTSAGVFVHRGTDASVPAVNLQQSAGWNCCGYDPGIASDPAGGHLLVAWYSNATGHGGLAAQLIDPASAGAIGAPQLMPGSSQSQPGERTQVVARPGSGIYLADGGGDPATRALIWRYGAAASTVVGSSRSGVDDVGVAADPTGRLWSFWRTGSGNTTLLHARRSNPAVTRWGAEVLLRAPAGETDIWKLDGNAQSSKLDLLGLFTVAGSVATWDTQVLPGLTISVKAHSGGKLTVTVTDAGQPVSGATVRAAGHSARANHQGVAKLNIGRVRSHVLTTAAKAGYTSASLTVTLPR